MKYWVIAFRDVGTHEIVGPVWNMESKIKPTKWAKERCYDGCEYAVMETSEDFPGIRDSVLQALTWYAKE